jgi:hypothetical protein
MPSLNSNVEKKLYWRIPGTEELWALIVGIMDAFREVFRVKLNWENREFFNLRGFKRESKRGSCLLREEWNWREVREPGFTAAEAIVIWFSSNFEEMKLQISYLCSLFETAERRTENGERRCCDARASEPWD